MINLFINISRYLFVITSVYFFYTSIKLNSAINHKRDMDINYYFNAQRITVLLSHFMGYVVLVIMRENPIDYLILYLEQFMFFMVIWMLISKIYKQSNLLIWNLTLYLISISFLILTRLDYAIGLRQFRIAIVGFIIALIIPIVFTKLWFLSKLVWVYIIIAFLLLFIVNDTVNGANNWFTLGDFSFQPSEVVKILYILFLASLFSEKVNRVRVIISAILTAGIVITLVYQKDLGAALIFYVLYVTILYLRTNKARFFYGGLLAGSFGAFIGYRLFTHVRVRVEAWYNPWADIDRTGYQITQSLFAIGAGGWLGTGLTRGLVVKIPVVSTDFIYAALCEEFGNIFSILLIGILMLYLIVIFNKAQILKDNFNYILVIGLCLMLAFQQFLIIGGVTKLIPSTGVTLPFISYGGTSLMVSCIMLGIIQGIFLLDTKTQLAPKGEEV